MPLPWLTLRVEFGLNYIVYANLRGIPVHRHFQFLGGLEESAKGLGAFGGRYFDSILSSICKPTGQVQKLIIIIAKMKRLPFGRLRKMISILCWEPKLLCDIVLCRC